MDEVGRGTTVQDGLAIAFATVQHLYHVNKSRALFATHFHELVDMLDFSEASQSSEIFPQLAFYCTDIDETEVSNFSLGSLTLSHSATSGWTFHVFPSDETWRQPRFSWVEGRATGRYATSCD